MAAFIREQRHAVGNQSPSGFLAKFCCIVSVDIFNNLLPSINSLAVALYFLKRISHACEHIGGYEARVFRTVRADESDPLGPNVDRFFTSVKFRENATVCRKCRGNQATQHYRTVRTNALCDSVGYCYCELGPLQLVAGKALTDECRDD